MIGITNNTMKDEEKEKKKREREGGEWRKRTIKIKKNG